MLLLWQQVSDHSVGDVWNRMKQLETENQELRGRVEEEKGREEEEKGRVEGKRRRVEEEKERVKEEKGRVEEDLSCVLHVIGNGVQTGELKVRVWEGGSEGGKKEGREREREGRRISTLLKVNIFLCLHTQHAYI